MAMPIISERVVNIDNKSGSPTDYTALLVGGMDKLGEMTYPAQDVTGAADVAPVRKATGFKVPSNFTLQFEADVGGTPDPVDDFVENATANNPRTVLATFNTTTLSWTATGEANIIRSTVIAEPGENGVTLVEVEFEPTGVWTPSLS